MTHLTRWRRPDGSICLAAYTAQHSHPSMRQTFEFELNRKGIKWKWEAATHVWLVDLNRAAALRDILTVCFVPYEAQCGPCWAGGTCATWTKINKIASEQPFKFGCVEAFWKEPAPPPPPPRPKPPRPRAAALPQDPFTLLGVMPGASAEEIKKAARKQAFDAHPDRGGSAEKMMAILAARDELLGRGGRASRRR